MVAGTRHRVRSLGSGQRGACTQATDVSKAADAVFVMLILSLPTAQRGALTRSIRARARTGWDGRFARALVSPFTYNAVSISCLRFSSLAKFSVVKVHFLSNRLIRGIFAKFLII